MLEPTLENYQIWPIDKLHNWAKNPRAILKEDYERLKALIIKKGTYKPMIITADGTVLGGNMRLRVLRDLGVKSTVVTIVDAPTEADQLEIAISDNDQAGYWVEQAVAELIMKTPDLQMDLLKLNLGKPIPLTELLSKFAPDPPEDITPPLEDVAISKPGEFYRMGKHMLYCGDSTEQKEIEYLFNHRPVDGSKNVLVFTDPPYGIEVAEFGKVGADFGVAKKGEYVPVANDESTDAAKNFMVCLTALGLNKRIILWGGNYFVNFLPLSTGWLIWDKRGDTGIRNTFADGEMAWCSFHTPVRIYKQLWNGMIREGEHEKRVHPTQKPIGVLSRIIKDFSNEGDIIFDGFLGSGSTLIAAEQVGRICYGIELDPRYCDVIRKRYAKLLGKEEQWQELSPAV